MPISFLSMPPHIQLQMAKKLTFKGAAALEQTSYVSKMAVQRVRTRFAPLKVSNADISFSNEEISFRFGGKMRGFTKVSDIPRLRFAADVLRIEDDLTNDFGEKLLDFARMSRSTCSVLYVTMNRRAELCPPAVFYELLQEVQAKRLVILGNASPEYIKNLPKNVKKFFVESRVQNDDLKEIKTADFTIGFSEIDSVGLNSVLKEWIDDKREIESVHIRTLLMISMNDILEGIDGYKTVRGSGNKRVFELISGKKTLYVGIDETGTFMAAPALSGIFGFY